MQANVSLEQRVADRMRELVAPGSRCLVAVSGGPDSIALLDLLYFTAAEHECLLAVGHVDHGIHPGSGTIAKLVREQATARGLQLHLRVLTLGAGTSETRARAARRAALRELAAEAEATVIVLAHHADDQAETVLLRLLRGSGPAGLAGMASRRGPWVRPLLDVRREALAAHLASRGSPAWHDPANADRRHLRSWLRTEVMPVVAERLPDVVERLGGASRQAGESRGAWSQLLAILPGLDLVRTDRGISVAAPVLKGYRSALRHAVLAALGRQVGVLFGARRLRVLDQLLDGQSGGPVTVAAAVHAELAFGRLTFYWNGAVIPAPVPLHEDGVSEFDGARFVVKAGVASGMVRQGWVTTLVPGNYLLRSWRPGDRVRPLGGNGSRAVAVLMREAKIGPARRHQWPVLVTGDDATIVWVPGICRSDAGVPATGDEAWHVECAFA